VLLLLGFGGALPPLRRWIAVLHLLPFIRPLVLGLWSSDLLIV
jgi:hypothetical protein